MSIERLKMLKTRLKNYQECEEAILTGAQSYQIGKRELTRADLSEIANMIKYLENEIVREEAINSGKKRNTILGIVPRDI